MERVRYIIHSHINIVVDMQNTSTNFLQGEPYCKKNSLKLDWSFLDTAPPVYFGFHSEVTDIHYLLDLL